MGRFFSMDNKFFTFMNKVADLCILNIIYSDRYCRSIYYGYVLCDTEDGPE